MKKILIADASKASLVITSEVLKDHFLGVQVVVARTSQEAQDLFKTTPDLDFVIIDFDLPDKDGAQTAMKLKKIRDCPILVTAFERDYLAEFLLKEVSGYSDLMDWIRKPIKPESFVQIVNRFKDGKIRLKRRVSTSFPVMVEAISSKGSSYYPAQIQDVGLSGVKLEILSNSTEGKKTRTKKVNFPWGEKHKIVLHYLKKMLNPDTNFLDEKVQSEFWELSKKSIQFAVKKSTETSVTMAKFSKTKLEKEEINNEFSNVKCKLIWENDANQSMGLEVTPDQFSKHLFHSTLETQSNRTGEFGTDFLPIDRKQIQLVDAGKKQA